MSSRLRGCDLTARVDSRWRRWRAFQLGGPASSSACKPNPHASAPWPASRAPSRPHGLAGRARSRLVGRARQVGHMCQARQARRPRTQLIWKSNLVSLRDHFSFQANVATPPFLGNTGIALQGREHAACDPGDASHPKPGWRAQKVHLGCQADMDDFAIVARGGSAARGGPESGA